MSGICIAGGTPMAPSVAGRVLDSMPATNAEKYSASIAEDIAIGAIFSKTTTGYYEDKNTGITVVLDGEIFDDRSRVSHPAKVIAELYKSGRCEKISDLNGSFSAIVVDSSLRKAIFATDRFASRPLFVWIKGKAFSAATSLDALLKDDRIPRKLSLQGLMELISFQRTVADHTQYTDINVMPGAQIWVLEDGKVTKAQSWKLKWEKNRISEKECVLRLVDAMKSSARRRLSDNLKYGLLFSGGLDSRWVLANAREVGAKISCCTLGTFYNMEVSLAESVARLAGSSFQYYETPPLNISSNLDMATRMTHGLFVAPMNFLGVLPALAEKYDVLLSGHGLDYTLRGYYLPCATLRIAGSKTRMPRLRNIPTATPSIVERNIRVGIKKTSIDSIIRPEIKMEYERRRIRALEDVFALVEIENPYDAWDAFILHSLGRHYAYSDFVAILNFIEHRALTFDLDVMDIYLSMPPEWRASGRVAHAAMMAVGSDLMEIPDANYGFSASNSFFKQSIFVMGRAFLRRIGLVKREPLPDPMMTHGSWANYKELFRRDPAFVKKLKRLHENSALLDTGIFSSQGLATVVCEHLDGKEDHIKLLHELLTLASWFESHTYTGVVND